LLCAPSSGAPSSDTEQAFKIAPPQIATALPDVQDFQPDMAPSYISAIGTTIDSAVKRKSAQAIRSGRLCVRCQNMRHRLGAGLAGPRPAPIALLHRNPSTRLAQRISYRQPRRGSGGVRSGDGRALTRAGSASGACQTAGDAQYRRCGSVHR
jgi:hypothetical protein